MYTFFKIGSQFCFTFQFLIVLLVVQTASHGLERGPAAEVFRGDQLEAGFLTSFFGPDQIRNFRIIDGQRLLSGPFVPGKHRAG